MGAVGKFLNNIDKKLRGVPEREAAKAAAKAQADAQKEILANQQREVEKKEKATKEKQENISKKATEDYTNRRRRRIGKASLISTSETGTTRLGTQDILGA